MPLTSSSYLFEPDFNAKVALEALNGDKSTAGLAKIISVDPARILARKRQLLESTESVFEGKRPTKAHVVDELYETIGKPES
jgi:hypothetical protein